MAKYEDYLQKQDELEGEIQEAAEDHQERVENPDAANALPERFRDKTPEEIAASYIELEKRFSQQGNDLGTLRQTVDQFMKLQSEAATTEPTEPEADPLSVDDIYDNPDEAIRRVVREEAGSKIEQLERQLAEERFNTQMQGLDAKYPGWREKAQSPEFLEWVQSSPYRARMAQAADVQNDIQAADDLIGMYYELSGAAQQAQEFQRDQQLQQATLESSGPEQPEMVDTFSRADLMNARIAAKRGDQQAITWLNANREAIAIAYEEGHITD
jgi:ribosomal protein L29